MPTVEVNGVRLHYEERGRGERVVCFSHGLLWSTVMYEPQLRDLGRDHRCIAWDHRGQGASESPVERSHQLETCYHDARALLDRLEIGRCDFVGLSMGGFVGMRLAARHPERVRSLSLLATAADREPRGQLRRYRLLNVVARSLGVGAVAGRVLPIMFGPSFLDDPARAGERRRWTGELRRNRRSIYRAVNGAIERESCVDELANLRCPTLVLHGDEDRAISRERARETCRAIAGARFVPLERAGHTMTVENPEGVNRALREFLAGLA